MTILGIDIDLTTDYLEEHFEDEVECEAAHDGYDCSVDVVAIFESCEPPFLICEKARTFVVTYIADVADLECGVCGVLVGSHWSVRPV